MPCAWRKTGKLLICDFELLALPSNLKKGEIHVYEYSEHNHAFKPEGKSLLWVDLKFL
jgi:hypothetical protein